jgi:hypothetical protein
MKKLLVITMVLTSFVSYGQIQEINIPKSTIVGSIIPMNVFITELTYTTQSNGEKVYEWKYRNGKYTTLDSYEIIKFSGDGNTLETLYGMIKNVFKSDDIKNYNKEVMLGNSLLIIKGYRYMGINGVTFFTEKGWIPAMNEKQIDKLFGK